ncbi:MAG: PEP/pyruvate-binding domain-containing protein [Pseudomonadota bacterium]
MTKTRHKSAARLSVYDLNGRDGVPGAELAGFKAHNLIRMAAMGLPVPQGFVMGTDWCAAVREAAGSKLHLPDALQAGVRDLERVSGLGFGSPRRPLLVSVRSGAPVSMPGMMETVLNVGLNDASLTGLLRLTGDHRLAWDSYRRLIQAFAEIVAGVPAAPFEAALEATLRRTGSVVARQLDFRAMRDLAHASLELYRDHTGRDFPQDPFEQLAAATEAVFASWMSDKAVEYRRLNTLPDDLGTAVTVQRMVFGNAGGNSGAGVGFTRDPSTGENRLYIDWLQQAQGEDIVSGRRRVTAENDVPVWLMQKLGQVGEALEKSFCDAQEFEFTVENGELFMLQTRTAKRTALASLRMAVDQVDSGLITVDEALDRLSGIDLDAITIRRVESAAPPLAHAIPAGIGVAQGPAAFSVRAAQAFAARGTSAILIRNDVATSDIAGIAVVGGVLTASGGRTSHAAVVARQMGKVCLVGCTDLVVDEPANRARLGDAVLNEGDPVCLDGDTGAVYADAPAITSERPDALLARVQAWRDGAMAA